ncbi:unnamed protein product [Rhodiola kirilowii]
MFSFDFWLQPVLIPWELLLKVALFLGMRLEVLKD